MSKKQYLGKAPNIYYCTYCLKEIELPKKRGHGGPIFCSELHSMLHRRENSNSRPEVLNKLVKCACGTCRVCKQREKRRKSSESIREYRGSPSINLTEFPNYLAELNSLNKFNFGINSILE